MEFLVRKVSSEGVEVVSTFEIAWGRFHKDSPNLGMFRSYQKQEYNSVSSHLEISVGLLVFIGKICFNHLVGIRKSTQLDKTARFMQQIKTVLMKRKKIEKKNTTTTFEFNWSTGN